MIKEAKRIIGIDFGSKRIGVAISDELLSLAFPLKVISGFGHDVEKRDLKMDETKKGLMEIIKEREVNTVVIGKSVDLKGFDNAIMQDAKILGDYLSQNDIEVVYEPEMYSTVQATKFQGENKDVDASAAAIILQSYLDRLKFKTNE